MFQATGKKKGGQAGVMSFFAKQGILPVLLIKCKKCDNLFLKLINSPVLLPLGPTKGYCKYLP